MWHPVSRSLPRPQAALIGPGPAVLSQLLAQLLLMATCKQIGAALLPAATGLNKEHQAWLTNVLNREAVGLVCMDKGPMHQEELAKLLGEHFTDLLESLNAEPESEDDEAEVVDVNE